MKKFLSLVLALVMTMSLVTISAGAKDFTDGDKVTYNEAIDVMSALKVIDGYTDGSFKPTTQLNRGQAAKILCNMILGPTTASALKADAAPFKDVAADNTFAGYIAYCAKAGIIDGYTDGTFRPSAPLTGYAFMKLLLGALGYDKDVEGYNTPNWSINVAKQALGIGLDKGLTGEFDGTKIVTREEACLYALNTLKATMVEYETKTSINVGGAEVTIAGSKAKEVEQGTYKSYTGNVNDKTLQFCERYFKDLTKEPTTDAFGRPSTTWRVKNNEVGTYANNGMLVATFEKKVTKADVYAALGKSVVDDLAADKAELWASIDGVDTLVAPGKVKTDYASKNDSGKVNSTGNGSLTEIYLDTDTNDAWIVTVNTYVFQAVSDYNSKKESVEIVSASDNTKVLNDRTLELDDFPGLDTLDIKADDYLLITNAEADNGKFDVQSVAKAEVVTGDVAGYKVEDSVELGGTTYSYSATADATAKGTLYTVGQEAAVVLDEYGYIIAVDKAVVAKNYVFVSQFGSTSALNSNAVANAFFTDGTSEEIVIKEAYDKVNDARVTDKATIGGTSANQFGNGGAYNAYTGWFTYSKNTNGQYNLYAIPSTSLEIDTDSTLNYSDDGNSANDVVTINNKVSFLGSSVVLKDAGSNVKTTAADDDTILVLKDNKGNVSVYTGVKNIPDITLKKGATSPAGDGKARVSVVNGKNGYADYVFVHVTGAVSISGGADTEMVYVIGYDGEHRTTDNVQYWTYKTLVDGKKEIVQADSQGVAGTEGNIFNVYFKARSDVDSRLTQLDPLTDGGYDGKFYYENSADSTVNGGITYSNGALSIEGTGYTLAKDAKITLVTLGKLKNNAGSQIADARVLNKDKDASYEVADAISGKILADTLKGYDYDYSYAFKATEANGTVIEQLFVTIVNAAETVAPSDDTSIASVTAADGTVTTTTYATQALAEANPVSVDWKNTTYSLTVAPTATGATAAVEFYNFGGAALGVAGNSPVTVDQKVAYSFKITVTAPDGTVGDPVWVAVKPVKTVAYTGLAVTFANGSATKTIDATFATLTPAATCELADLAGTLSYTVYKYDGGWQDVVVGSKPVANGALTSFTVAVPATGNYKVEWTLTIGDAVETGTVYNIAVD